MGIRIVCRQVGRGGGTLQLTCYMCRCYPAGCLFWNIRYRPVYFCPKIWFITGYALKKNVVIQGILCWLSYTFS